MTGEHFGFAGKYDDDSETISLDGARRLLARLKELPGELSRSGAVPIEYRAAALQVANEQIRPIIEDLEELIRLGEELEDDDATDG